MRRRGFWVALLLVACIGRAGAEALPDEVTIKGVEFVRIPAGWFYKSGGVHATDERGRIRENEGFKRIWLDDFYMARYEALATHFADYLNATQGGDAANYSGSEEGCTVRFGDDGRFETLFDDPMEPATFMTWSEAVDFATWMGFRLPTEAEWEKAARGTDRRRWPWGDEYPNETHAGFQAGAMCSTTPVDRFPKGVSPYGLYNMSGNIREYVQDSFSEAYDANLPEDARNPAPPTDWTPGARGQMKLIKGGRWADYPDALRIGFRLKWPIDRPFRCNGLRFAVDAEVVRRHLADG